MKYTPTAKPSTIGLIKIYEEHNLGLKKRVEQGELTQSTLTKNTTILKKLRSFKEYKFSAEDIALSWLKRDFADEFHEYLMDEHGLSNNAAVTYVWMLGKVIRLAIDKGHHIVDPTQYYTYHKTDKKTVYLTEEQLQTIEELEIQDTDTALVRDLFIYSCYTGMSLQELKRVSFDNIRNIDGIYCFSIKRGDSYDSRIIPCLPKLMDIDNKYEDLRKRKHNRMIFPGIGNISTGKYLEEIGKLAGIPFRLKFETAKYTFATTVALKYKLPLFIIHDVLGYKAIQHTDEYQLLYELHVRRAFGQE